MRVVADTNVIISMLLWGGALERLFVLVNERKIILCFSPETIDELFRVARYGKIVKQAEKMQLPLETLLDKLIAVSIICYPTIKISVIENDESDNRILEVALESQATCIISGDNHLLELKVFRDIAIVSPQKFLRDFWHLRLSLEY